MVVSRNLLEGQRVRLTAVAKDDLPAIAHWHEDTRFGRLFDAMPAYPKTAEQWSEWLKEEQASQTAFLFGIRPLAGEELWGYMSINGILWPHQSAWLAIGIGEPAKWNQGYGREALQLAIEYAFDELNLYRLQATIFSYNERSQALFEKLGFQREGMYREFLQRDGQRYDMILYGLLRREWRKSKT